MKPTPGYYRKLLSDSEIRIAFTHTPIIGCTRIDNLPIINELKKSTDEFAEYYIEGLENREMQAIVENHHYQEYYAPGELYFKS